MNARRDAVLLQIRALQSDLGMSDGEIILLAQQVCGCDQIRSVSDLLACELLELLEDLQGMAEISGLVGMAT